MYLKRYLPLLSIFFAQVLSGSHWTSEQVVQYVHHSELQRRSSWQLLSQIKFLGTEDVLDIGCGDGRNTAWISCWVKNGSTTGIDPCVPMIEWAQKQYAPQEFSNLSFYLGDFFSMPSEQMYDVITSFFSLHIVEDKEAALKQVYQKLKPGGRFVAVAPPFNTNPTYDQAFQATQKDPKWSGYFTAYKPSFLFVDVDTYQTLLENAGFTDVQVAFRPSVDPFVDKEEFIAWFLGTFPHMHYLPKEQRALFVEDVLQRYAQLRPEAFSSDGVVRGFWGRIEMTAKKSEK